MTPWDAGYEDEYVAPIEDGEPVAATEHLLDQVEALVPDEWYDPEEDVRVSEYLGEDTCDLDAVQAYADRLPIDGGSLCDGYGVKALAGDGDIHGGNIQVREDGMAYPHDFEQAGSSSVAGVYRTVRMMASGQPSLGPSFDSMLGLTLGGNIEGGFSPTRLRDHIGAVADSVDREALAEAYRDDDRVRFREDLDAVQEYSPAERIFTNVVEAQERRVGTIGERLYDRVRERF